MDHSSNLSESILPNYTYRKLKVSRAGKVIVHSGKTVVPGEILGIYGTSVKNLEGTWLENRFIRSDILGTVTVNTSQDENETLIKISVSRPNRASLSDVVLPTIGDVVIAEVISVDILEVHCSILVVGGIVLESPIQAIMRMENIEPLNPHLVELEDHFAIRDLVLARVRTLDFPVVLDVVGDAKLGVVMSWSAAGCQMIPIGAHEVICPETFAKIQKRLSTAVCPVKIPLRK